MSTWRGTVNESQREHTVWACRSGLERGWSPLIERLEIEPRLDALAGALISFDAGMTTFVILLQWQSTSSGVERHLLFELLLRRRGVPSPFAVPPCPGLWYQGTVLRHEGPVVVRSDWTASAAQRRVANHFHSEFGVIHLGLRVLDREGIVHNAVIRRDIQSDVLSIFDDELISGGPHPVMAFSVSVLRTKNVWTLRCGVPDAAAVPVATQSKSYQDSQHKVTCEWIQNDKH